MFFGILKKKFSGFWWKFLTGMSALYLRRGTLWRKKSFCKKVFFCIILELWTKNLLTYFLTNFLPWVKSHRNFRETVSAGFSKQHFGLQDENFDRNISVEIFFPGTFSTLFKNFLAMLSKLHSTCLVEYLKKTLFFEKQFFRFQVTIFLTEL